MSGQLLGLVTDYGDLEVSCKHCRFQIRQRTHREVVVFHYLQYDDEAGWQIPETVVLAQTERDERESPVKLQRMARALPDEEMLRCASTILGEPKADGRLEVLCRRCGDAIKRQENREVTVFHYLQAAPDGNGRVVWSISQTRVYADPNDRSRLVDQETLVGAVQRAGWWRDPTQASQAAADV